VRVHWLSLGELSRLIETFQREGVHQAVMAGQVKHKQIFSSIRPDWRLAKLLLSLRTRNTDMLLGAVAKVLGDEGIELIASTAYLEPLLALPGVLTARAPNEQEQQDISYGREMARGLAAFDLGQTVVVAAQACIAIEAMEGTDATIERAGALMRSLGEPDGGQSRETETGPALRCSGDRHSDNQDDDGGRRDVPRARSAANADLRPGCCSRRSGRCRNCRNRPGERIMVVAAK
jgi:hypothetical protein